MCLAVLRFCSGEPNSDAVSPIVNDTTKNSVFSSRQLVKSMDMQQKRAKVCFSLNFFGSYRHVNVTSVHFTYQFCPTMHYHLRVVGVKERGGGGIQKECMIESKHKELKSREEKSPRTDTEIKVFHAKNLHIICLFFPGSHFRFA